jgi:hypothetical protein
MRAGLVAVAGVLVAFLAATADAQQGAVQVSAASQVLTGDSNRLAGQERFEPDFGVTWLQPGSRFGMFQMEVRGTERDDRLHAGRTFAAIRDARYRGLIWTVEAGDTYLSPSIGDYRFTNLFTPPVTFSGAALSARSTHTSVVVAAGNATAWRNIFGTDPETLDQTLGAARVTHRFSSTVDANVRASRTRTSDLGEFVYTIEASDQAGGGIRYALSPDIQLVADGSFVSYRRRGAKTREHDASGLVGAHWLHARGWLQMNAYRFSPGEMPTLNSPLPDREGLFAAGEYDLHSRLRVFAGDELFRSNLNVPTAAEAVVLFPQTTGLRLFGGVRVRVGSKSTMTLRVEDGDRISQPVTGGTDSDSDTGSWAADWQTAVGRFTGNMRYARRENVDRARTEGSYSQHDAAAQVFVGLSRSAQLFGLVTVTRIDQAIARNTYWQAGGGGQLQVFSRNLWMRAEGNVSRNIDLLLESDVPRESLNLGVNGQLTPLTTLGVSVYLDRAPTWSQDGSAWVTRSMLRVTRSFPTAGPYSAGRPPLLTAAALERGTGSVRGLVYADWNANGVQDADETPLEGIPLLLPTAGAANTRRSGEIAFVNVPVGLREIALDVAALPVDYDPPSIPKVLVDVVKGQAAQVAFGLIPLGAVRGRVVRDTNGNGAADEGDEAVDGAVLVLDDGQRSERVRRGRFAFEAVRSGAHRVKLLVESLPEGSVIAGDVERQIVVQRGQLEPDVSFLISLERRPEIRRVFPGRQSPPASSPARTTSSAHPPPASPAPSGARTSARSTPVGSSTPADGRFAVQVAALNDPLRARVLVEELRRGGYPSYLLLPPATDPDAPFRIRVGRYASRADADEIAKSLERERGGRLWVVREVTTR